MQLLASGTVKPIPIHIWEKGLEGINDAMEYMMDGKVSHFAHDLEVALRAHSRVQVSGKKIIFRIADTPAVASALENS